MKVEDEMQMELENLDEQYTFRVPKGKYIISTRSERANKHPPTNKLPGKSSPICI